MRQLLAISLLLIALCPAGAQEQERKLLDRILKPDTTLQNDAQSKKFKADRSSTEKRATVGTFYLQEKSRTKGFANTRDFSTNEFNSRSSNNGDAAKTHYLSQQSATTANSYSLTTSKPATRPVHDANKTKNSRDYSGNRPFLDQGKSQKSLSRKNPPMTIEQVRELLNKNK